MTGLGEPVSTQPSESADGDILQQALKNIGLSQPRDQVHHNKEGNMVYFILFSNINNLIIWKCVEGEVNVSEG